MPNWFRVLHVVETVGSGGVEQRRLLLAEGLDSDRFEQKLVCTKAFGALPERLEAAGCPVHTIGTLPRIWTPEPHRLLREHVKHFRPHLIHGAVYEGVALAVAAGRWLRVPCVVGEETAVAPDRRWSGHALFAGLAHAADHMVAVSGPAARYLRQRLRLPRHRVSLILNGVRKPEGIDVEGGKRVREAFGWGPNDFVAGTAGRVWDRVKRVSDVIEAVARLQADVPNIRLLVVGDGPDRQRLEQMVADRGLASAIAFAGYQADLRPHYQAMDAFVLASSQESFGMVLVEAMFAGLPVVATSVGGIPDVVVPGETGALVAPGRPDQLAAELEVLYREPSRRRDWGKAGAERAAREFAAERYVRDVQQLYLRLLGKRGLTDLIYGDTPNCCGSPLVG